MIALLRYVQQKIGDYSTVFQDNAKRARDVGVVLLFLTRDKGMARMYRARAGVIALFAWMKKVMFCAKDAGVECTIRSKTASEFLLKRAETVGLACAAWLKASGIWLRNIGMVYMAQVKARGVELVVCTKAFGNSLVIHLGAIVVVLIAKTRKESKAFVRWIQHIFLGERNIVAAALIETPLRLQPNQRYALRINLVGRDRPALPAGVQGEAPLAGLSALAQGELVHIEVRAAIDKNDVSVVQQAEVHIPRHNYMAEIMLPMQPRSSGTLGQRERVHILFLDEAYRPLYEKPFVIELFISPLVQTGHEGYYALPIPL